MAKIKIKPNRSFPAPAALAGKGPRDLDSVKRKLAEVIILHHAVKAKKMANAPLRSKE